MKNKLSENHEIHLSIPFAGVISIVFWDNRCGAMLGGITKEEWEKTKKIVDFYLLDIEEPK